MPDNDTEVIVYETDNVVVSTSNSVEAVVTSITPNRVEVDLVESVFNDIEIVSDDTVVQVFQGDIFFASVDEELLSNAVRRTDFTVTSNVVAATYTYNLPSDARTVLHVMINQIDFIKWCAIFPLGSGQVVYTVPMNGYKPEQGDSVLIYWMR